MCKISAMKPTYTHKFVQTRLYKSGQETQKITLNADTSNWQKVFIYANSLGYDGRFEVSGYYPASHVLTNVVILIGSQPIG